MSTSSSLNSNSTTGTIANGGGGGGGDGHGPPNGVAAAARPPRLPRDWEDDRTHDDEKQFDGEIEPVSRRVSARPSTTVRGGGRATAITYGNRRDEAVQFMNDKDGANQPAIRMADRTLPWNGMTYALTSVSLTLEPSMTFHDLASPRLTESDYNRVGGRTVEGLNPFIDFGVDKINPCCHRYPGLEQIAGQAGRLQHGSN